MNELVEKRSKIGEIGDKRLHWSIVKRMRVGPRHSVFGISVTINVCLC